MAARAPRAGCTRAHRGYRLRDIADLGPDLCAASRHVRLELFDDGRVSDEGEPGAARFQEPHERNSTRRARAAPRLGIKSHGEVSGGASLHDQRQTVNVAATIAAIRSSVIAARRMGVFGQMAHIATVNAVPAKSIVISR